MKFQVSKYFFRRDWHSPYYKFDGAEPIAGNYHPITNKIIFSDNITSMAVLTDRAHGGSSLNDGEVEIMVSFVVIFVQNFFDL